MQKTMHSNNDLIGKHTQRTDGLRDVLLLQISSTKCAIIQNNLVLLMSQKAFAILSSTYIKLKDNVINMSKKDYKKKNSLYKKK